MGGGHLLEQGIIIKINMVFFVYPEERTSSVQGGYVRKCTMQQSVFDCTDFPPAVLINMSARYHSS